MDSLKLKAMAKINLGLDVLKRRADGYHEVKMVMQTVGIYDELEMRKLPEDRIILRTDRAGLPTDERNLVYKAVKIMKEQFSIRQGVLVYLSKTIPVAAGMAGGSADAAAALAGMNRLFRLGLELEQLQKLGVKLGADVPYCLMGGTALSEGIGEKLTALPPVPVAYLVVAKPDFNVSTKYVYENLHLERLTGHPDIDGMVDSIKNGDLSGVTARMENVLETVTVKRFPMIGEMKSFLKEQGAENALMSGSGPTVFGVFREKDKAQDAFTALKKKGYTKQVYLTGFISTEAGARCEK